MRAQAIPSTVRPLPPFIWKAFLAVDFSLAFGLLPMSRPAPVRNPEGWVARPWRALPLAVAALLLPAGGGWPQEEAPVRNPLSFEEDDGVKRFLAEAEDLEKAGRWREALVRYRRALARNPDHLCPIPGGAGPTLFSGTAEYVARRVSGYPPEGLAAYRAEYDAPAQGLFEAFLKDGRTEHLETVLADYFFATLGDDAAHLLAERWFDAGRVAEAARLWDRILRLYPAPSIPPPLLAARLIMARRLMGEGEPDADLRGRLAGVPVRVAGATVAGDALADALGRFPVSPPPPVAGRSEAFAAVLPDSPGLPAQWLDRPDRPRTRPEDPRLLSNDLRLWTPLPLFSASAGHEVSAEDRMRRQQMALFAANLPAVARGQSAPPLWPAAARDEEGRDAVIVQNGHRILALDPANGRLLWRNPPAGRAGDRTTIDLLGGMVFACVTDGRRVYANMMLPPAPPAAAPAAGAFAMRWDRMPEGPRTIRCYDIPTGRLLWDAFGDPRKEEVEEGADRRNPVLQFPSPVAAGDGRVYAAGLVRQNDQEIYVCAFRADTGALLWKRYLASAPRTGMGWRGMIDTSGRVPCVTEAGGIVYCLTNIGAVAALHGADGRVLWLTRYPAETEEANGRPSASRSPSPPAVSGSRLVVLPQDAAKAFCLDARTGALEDSFGNAAETPFLVGIHAVGLRPLPAALLAGRQVTCHLLDGSRRSPSLSQTGAPVVARGAVADGVLYLPLKRGLLRYDLATLKIVDSAPQPWVEEADAGNLVFAGDLLVAAGRDRLSAYADFERYVAGEGAVLFQTPPHPPALLKQGLRFFGSGRYEEALTVLVRATALLEAGRADDDPSLAEARESICRSACGHAETLIAGGDPRRLTDALGSLRRAEPHARRDDLRARLFLGAARAHLVLGRPDGPGGGRHVTDAVLAAQEVIDRVPRALVPAQPEPGGRADVAGRRALAGRLAEELISSLLDKHGRDVYREVEARAAEGLAEALRGLPVPGAGVALPDTAAAEQASARLAALIGRYPHSDAAWEAARRRVALAAGPGAVVGALVHYLEESAPSPGRRAEALLALASVSDPAAARRALETARRLAPEAVVADPGPGAARRTVREAVEARLADLGTPPPPSDPLDLGAGRHRVKTVAAGESSMRLCVPEQAGGGPSPLPPDRLLLARGSSLLLWDLEKGAPVWSCPCPKGDVGFELVDDPAAGTKDGVFIYPGPAGDPARKAGLEDRDLVVRIDGVPVTADETRQALAAVRPGVPLRLEVRRGTKEVAVTFLPRAWPEDREPYVQAETAAWIPGGGVAVSWKDRVAAVTPADGADRLPRWVFPPPGAPAIVVEGLQASRRCVFVRYRAAEAAAGDEEASPVPQRQVILRGRVVRGGQVWQPDGRKASQRETFLVGLDAATGLVLWERVYPPGTLDPPFVCDLVLPGENLLVRAVTLLDVPEAGEEATDEENVKTRHLVEVIDGRSGRVIGPGAPGPVEAAVEALALDGEAGWLAFVQGGADLQVFDLFARPDRKKTIRLAQRPESRNARGDGAPALALAAAGGRVAAVHGTAAVEIAEPGGDALADRIGKGVSRQFDPSVPGAVQWDGPDRLVLYSQSRQDGFLSFLHPGEEPKVLWETVETRHGGGLDPNRELAVPATVILPPTARHLFKLDAAEGALRCFDKTREGAFARELKLPPAGPGAARGAATRVCVDGERLLVEAGGEITVYRK